MSSLSVLKATLKARTGLNVKFTSVDQLHNLLTALSELLPARASVVEEDNHLATIAHIKDAPPVEPVTTTTEDALSYSHWKKSKAFISIKCKETQIKYYKRMGAPAEVLSLVELDSKPFGTACENIISEILHLGPRTSTQNDGTLDGKKIEIKSARYWAGKDNCKWQHLEPDHDYEYALFVILGFQGFNVWCIKKSLLMGELRDKKIVTFQGKQGWWTTKSVILPYLTPIKTVADLRAFIH